MTEATKLTQNIATKGATCDCQTDCDPAMLYINRARLT